MKDTTTSFTLVAVEPELEERGYKVLLPRALVCFKDFRSVADGQQIDDAGHAGCAEGSVLSVFTLSP